MGFPAAYLVSPKASTKSPATSKPYYKQGQMKRASGSRFEESKQVKQSDKPG
jgi:hypothetical protein